MPPHKLDAVAALVRGMIADGTLKPGGPVPFGTELARTTGFSLMTCRAALAVLVADGTLVRGRSENSRLRVAPSCGGGPGREALLRDALSRALAAFRRARGLTQAGLAGLAGLSPTTVGLAETGHGRQSRENFWAPADRLLGADGSLLLLYDACQAAAAAEPGEPAPARPVPPASVAWTPDGVLVTWPGGAQTLARPPGWQPPA